MISVIMSAYNEHIYEIKNSINSILNQTISNFELIIVDDNPNYYNLKNYLLNIKDNRIRVYFNKKNLGAGKSRNVGVKHACGEFIAIIDADDVSVPYRFEKQLDFLKSNNLDFVFSNYKVLKQNKYLQVYNFNSINNSNIMKYVFTHYDNISLQSSWFVKKEVFDKLNGYRDIIIEDYDFNIRAITYGYKLGYQSEALVIKKERQGSISDNNLLKQYVTFKAIQKFAKKDKFNNIFSINQIKRNTFMLTTPKEIEKFQTFLNSGHGIKYHINTLHNIIVFIYSLFRSLNAMSFFFNLFNKKFKDRKLNKILRNCN